jgi:hypothetical protein
LHHPTPGEILKIKNFRVFFVHIFLLLIKFWIINFSFLKLS